MDHLTWCCRLTARRIISRETQFQISQKKLATPVELEPDKWEVGLVEISYPKVYKKQQLHNTVRLDSMEIKFPVRHYTSLHDIFVTLKKHIKTPDEKQEFVNTFHGYLNKYVPSDGYVKELFGVCYGQNSLQIGEKFCVPLSSPSL
jgi:hypothetical protein